MGKYKNAVARATMNYQDTLKGLKAALPGLDAANAGSRYWQDLTGSSASVHLTSKAAHLHVYMSAMTKGGRYVSRRHFNELLEIVDDELQARGYETEVSSSEDDYSIDVTLKAPDFVVCLHSWHGGQCDRVQIGTETVEKPIYETRCA